MQPDATSRYDRHDLNDGREPGRLAAGLRVRIALRDLRLVVLDRHARRKRHRLFAEPADVELVRRRRVEDQLALLLQHVAVVRHQVDERRGRCRTGSTAGRGPRRTTRGTARPDRSARRACASVGAASAAGAGAAGGAGGGAGGWTVGWSRPARRAVACRPAETAAARRRLLRQSGCQQQDHRANICAIIRRAEPRRGRRQRLTTIEPMTNTVKTALLLGAMSALLLFLGESLGGAQGLVLGFVFAVVTNFVSYWFSDKIVLAMYRAKEVGPDHRLYQIVARLAQRAGLPMPQVYVIPQPSPNAFATGRNPEHAAVAATEGILQILNDDELEGVIAHELAHVKHRDILISSVAATLAAAIMMIARFAMFFGGGRATIARRQPDRAAGDDHPGADRGDADSGGDLAVARVRRRRRRRGDCRQPDGLVSALRKIESGVARGAARRQPGDGAHVHHQAVLARRR